LETGLSPCCAGCLFRRFTAALARGQANAAYLTAAGIQADRSCWPPTTWQSAFQAAAPAAEREAQAWRQNKLGIDPAAPVVLFAGKFGAQEAAARSGEAFSRLGHPSGRVGGLVAPVPLESELGTAPPPNLREGFDPAFSRTRAPCPPRLCAGGSGRLGPLWDR